MQQPIWTHQPPQDKYPTTLTLRRCRNGIVTGIALTDHPVGTMVHWWRGRTRPCTKLPHCEACQSGQNPRWKGYLPLYDPQSRTTWIQEFTSYASQAIQEGIRSFASLRGHQITFRRRRGTDNSPLDAYVSPSQAPHHTLPPPIDIIPILYRIWDYNTETTQIRSSDDQ